MKSPTELTASEARILAASRRMSGKARAYLVDIAQGFAEEFPAPRHAFRVIKEDETSASQSSPPPKRRRKAPELHLA